jgi:hypothetical protein
MAASRFQVVSAVRSLRIPAPREPDVGVETLTATVSSTVTGSVQFEDGGADIGTPVIVSGGVASATTTLLPEIHRLNAVFTSTDPAFNGSTSPTVPYAVTVAPGAMATATSPRVFPSGASPGMTVVVLADVAALSAAGTLQFFDGITALDVPVPATGGFALLITKLPAGTHFLAAVSPPLTQRCSSRRRSNKEILASHQYRLLYRDARHPCRSGAGQVDLLGL